MIQVTELEAKLFSHIQKMSIDEQHQFLQFLDETFPELIEVEQEPTIERQQKVVTILQDIANSGGLDIDDPVAWQREQRQDRPLPGRED